MARVQLLDVNVLVALFDPDHIHHEPAHDWFSDHREHGWATCPLTENGFVRVITHPRYRADPPRLVVAARQLRQFCASGDHHFWNDTPSLRDEDAFSLGSLRGPAQVTDVYLLALAVQMKGTLVTFDRTIPLAAVHGASRDAIAVIAPASE